MTYKYYVPKEDKEIFFKFKSGEMKQIKKVFSKKSYNGSRTNSELIIFFFNKPQSMIDDIFKIEKIEDGVNEPTYNIYTKDSYLDQGEIILNENIFFKSDKFNTKPKNLFSFFVDGDGNVDSYYRYDYFEESDGSIGRIKGGTKRKYRINSGKKHSKSRKKNIKRRKSKKRKTRGK